MLETSSTGREPGPSTSGGLVALAAASAEGNSRTTTPLLPLRRTQAASAPVVTWSSAGRIGTKPERRELRNMISGLVLLLKCVWKRGGRGCSQGCAESELPGRCSWSGCRRCSHLLGAASHPGKVASELGELLGYMGCSVMMDEVGIDQFDVGSER